MEDNYSIGDLCDVINCDECKYADECDIYQEHLATISTERWKKKFYPALYD